jgi:Putative Actinobacterial Holin-X, holin superfamily III
MPELRDERTFGELLGQLSQDTTLLVRQELQLAKTEINEKISRATGHVASLATGGLVGWAGALAVVAGIILVLTQVVGLPAWLAALAVGAVLGITGLVMVRGALRNLKRIDPSPQRTVKTIEDDIQWAKEQP